MSNLNQVEKPMKKVIIYDIRALLSGNHTPVALVEKLAERIPHESREPYMGWGCYKDDMLFGWNYLGVDTDGILRLYDSIENFIKCDEVVDIELYICKVVKGDTL